MPASAEADHLLFVCLPKFEQNLGNFPVGDEAGAAD